MAARHAVVMEADDASTPSHDIEGTMRTHQIQAGRATVMGGRRRWLAGRAVQLGTTGARVVRNGAVGPREVKRSTFYRHTTGWLRV